LAAGCAGNSIAPGADLGTAPAPDLQPALPPGVSPLAGVDPSLPDGDLAPLGALTGDAHVVGLGESIHTSGGFARAKSRAVRFLVEKMGFRVLSFEWQRTSGTVVENFLASGARSATVAAEGLSVWANTDVRDLIQWLRDWNVAHPSDPVHFFGFDVQQPDTDSQALATYLQTAAPADAAALTAGLATCDTGQFLTTMKYAAADFTACMNGLGAVDQYFTQRQAALIAASSADAYEWARIALVGLRAWQPSIFYDATDLKQAMEARDSGMAYVFTKTRALRYPAARIILWAHNEHVSQHHDEIVGAFGEGARSMGTLLAAQLGADYVAVGLTGYDVGIDWPGVGCGSQTLPAPGDVEDRLRALGQEDLFVDLSQPFFTPGMSYGFAVWETLVPARQFQGLIYLQHSPKMAPLDWPPCTP
jgi:erythromycin esterase